MEHSYGGSGSWSMIPSMATHSNPATPSSSSNNNNNNQQDNNNNIYLQQQQQQFQQQYFQQPQRFQQPPPQHPQSLASHFHLRHLVENLADAIELGTRDPHSDAVVNELNSQFEKCQQLLNSISGSISTKAMTVEGQKQKLEESEQLLIQRRDLIAKYRNSVEELSNS